MSNIALRVENLGKMYRIDGPQEKYYNLRDIITHTASAPLRGAWNLLHKQGHVVTKRKEEIWALKDVSFEVNRGEIVGIIGRNGAGKSTLLKILSRITEPTIGYAKVYGRVGALLEVGTGFHPELTGRENIYLNGSILGMSRHNIDHKFDEIVDFAGVEKFIDTPVKHYSSGMGLRLGFAVAAHLEPEILVVDEVLAVGDAQFQQKCLNKMNDVAGEGRTVLFVSHNMGAVLRLCKTGIVLASGKNVFDGTADDAVAYYMSFLEKVSSNTFNDIESPFYISSVRLLNHTGSEASRFPLGSKIIIEISTELKENLPPTHINISIYYNGTLLFRSLDTDDSIFTLLDRPLGHQKYIFEINTAVLKPGSYQVSMDTSMKPYIIIHNLDKIITFDLYDPEGDFDKSWSEGRQGIIKAPGKWFINTLPN